MMNNDDTSNKKPNLLFISDIPLETSEPAQEVVKPEKPEKEKQTEEKFAFLIPKPNPEFDMPDEIIAENSAPNVCVSEKEPVLQKPTNKQELSKDIEKGPFKGKKIC
ncbi:MAG: hypothetical protein OMM_06333 [Candidatus Magnetoglobus multicellularis str. Araruama]|uniref:Uncharacterized protein n=1 Tax=Candidatus Magnetoglobus multicellularis str. Araruama TaxID=890399 RepID=A0A1V1PI43_9BACT|nr:MAG: hypothetical protein OMM_06333 [Candidatus Magnetoglobus multicellularis str. Araruama]